ncbi:MAG: 3-hydroxyacyl-ACP dehydratase FabZ family protein [Planctomycetota bacterium]
MRWLWIDRIVHLEAGAKIAAVKNVASSEDPFGEHFPGQPVMPGSLIIEGMAQTAGILVGHTGKFAEKVILAKVSDATLQADARPGDTLLYEAELKSFDTVGASTAGTVSLLSPGGDSSQPSEPRRIGSIDLVFSHLDQNRAGAEFPEHNFVFGPSFKMVLEQSGIKTGIEGGIQD